MPTKLRILNCPMDEETFTLLTTLARGNARSKAAEVRFLIRQAAAPTPMPEELVTALRQLARDAAKAAPGAGR